MFGYKITENFDHPYFKRNLSLFWKSWHISLTSWFRDYLFIPLGGSRVNFITTIKNTLIVMGLTGLWHGAAIHFMIWGLYHGVGLIILRLYNKYISNKLPPKWHLSKLVRISSTLITFHYVVIGWIFFTSSFEQSFYILKKLLFL
ncbi:MBOAT family O-acyltransferase [Phosphitispora sp. TUW77]|uniref:MBOAT family O-acyltransferase n=1 Tax=Phosphitispora sp. TUW77 TaxID=3152361 RepID=UPI003AB734E5